MSSLALSMVPPAPPKPHQRSAHRPPRFRARSGSRVLYGRTVHSGDWASGTAHARL